jgi:hypothetical protein
VPEDVIENCNETEIPLFTIPLGNKDVDMTKILLAYNAK